MAHTRLQSAGAAPFWRLANRQHGVVARRQLLELGMSRDAIQHRIARGRLHIVRRGVYAIGRRELTPQGWWMAAVLSCGAEAVLSHESAAALWGLRPPRTDRVEVLIPSRVVRRPRGVTAHRRASLPGELTRRNRIPVTTPIVTLVDIALRLDRSQLEAAVNEADKRDLAHPHALRSALDVLGPRPGVGVLRALLDHDDFRLTDSELERRFLPLASAAGLPVPETGWYLCGFEVDFYWPELGLVVETDGLRYHRTPAEQARDRLRDQTHAAAGLTPLRFTHAQIRCEPDRVQAVLAAVARRLGHGPAS